MTRQDFILEIKTFELAVMSAFPIGFLVSILIDTRIRATHVKWRLSGCFGVIIHAVSP